MPTDLQSPLPTAAWRRSADPAAGPTADPAALAAARLVAKLLDGIVTIPVINRKVGLDAVLGLIPGAGDLISGAIGTYIVLAAARLGVPKAVLGRMLLNLGTDSVVGAVPVVGDLFDVAWRANAKNARLLERALAEPKRAERASTWALVGLAVGAFAVVVGGLALAIWLAAVLVRHVA